MSGLSEIGVSVAEFESAYVNELRERVKALEAERKWNLDESRSMIEEQRKTIVMLEAKCDELLWALRWNTGKLTDSEYLGENIRAGARRAIEIERKYAITAPVDAGA